MQNMFLKIGVEDNSINGESTDLTATNSLGEEGHVDWIEIINYTHGVSQPASTIVSSAGGRTVERCHHQDFTITKYLDIATPQINQWCCMGNHIDKLVIELFRSDSSTSDSAPVLYMYYVLTDAIISSVTVGGEGGDLPVEQVTFNYGAIYWKYDPQNHEGGENGAPIGGGWDLITNKPPETEP